MLTSCWSQVVGTVTRITRQAATLSLLTVDGRPCRPDFTGIIRSQDVRQTAKDSVKVRLDSVQRVIGTRTDPFAGLSTDLVMLPTWRCRPSQSGALRTVLFFLVLLTDIVMSGADLARRFAIMWVHLPCLPPVLN